LKLDSKQSELRKDSDATKKTGQEIAMMKKSWAIQSTTKRCSWPCWVLLGEDVSLITIKSRKLYSIIHAHQK